MNIISEYPVASALVVILFVASCFLPTFVFLIKMIYSPCNDMQGGRYNESGNNKKTEWT